MTFLYKLVFMKNLSTTMLQKIKIKKEKSRRFLLNLNLEKITKVIKVQAGA